MREAELLESAPKAHFRQINAEALAEHAFEIDTTPARYPILSRVETGLDDLLQRFFLLVR